MNHIHCAHAQPTFAFRGRPLTLCLFVPDREIAVADIAVQYSVSLLGGRGGTQGQLRMLPTDGYCADECFSLYCVELPASELVGGDLSYRFLRDGIESESYTVPLCDEPPLPPLQITEYAVRLATPANFIELYNPTAKAVDLFDYELLLLRDGELIGRNPMAVAKGEFVIGAKQLAILRYISPSLLMHGEFVTTGKEQFLKDLARLYPEACCDIAERDITLFEVEIAKKGADGACFLKDGCFAPPFLPQAGCRLLIVPRGKDAEQAVFCLEADQGEISDAIACRSLLFDASAKEPRRGVCVDSQALASPGWADIGQRLLEWSDTTPPAILPLEPAGRVFLNGRDLRISFAVVGEGHAAPRVFVRTAQGFVGFGASIGRDGLYQTVIPYLTLSRIKGRFEYYIEVTGRLFAANCGDKLRPLSLRVVDRAGPSVLSVFPARGEVVMREPRPSVQITYEDVSGVDRHSCMLCLDGANVSGFAKWGANGVEYLPEKHLKRGEHVIELLLRDKLGNHTYYKSCFFVQGKSRRQDAAPSERRTRRKEKAKKAIRVALLPVQAVVLTVEAAAAVIDFFHSKK